MRQAICFSLVALTLVISISNAAFPPKCGTWGVLSLNAGSSLLEITKTVSDMFDPSIIGCGAKSIIVERMSLKIQAKLNYTQFGFPLSVFAQYSDQFSTLRQFDYAAGIAFPALVKLQGLQNESMIGNYSYSKDFSQLFSYDIQILKPYVFNSSANFTYGDSAHPLFATKIVFNHRDEEPVVYQYSFTNDLITKIVTTENNSTSVSDLTYPDHSPYLSSICVSLSNQKPTCLNFTYNDDNQLLSITDEQGKPEVTYTYNSDGQLLTIVSQTTNTTLIYDEDSTTVSPPSSVNNPEFLKTVFRRMSIPKSILRNPFSQQFYGKLFRREN